MANKMAPRQPSRLALGNWQEVGYDPTDFRREADIAAFERQDWEHINQLDPVYRSELANAVAERQKGQQLAQAVAEGRVPVSQDEIASTIAGTRSSGQASPAAIAEATSGNLSGFEPVSGPSGTLPGADPTSVTGRQLVESLPQTPPTEVVGDANRLAQATKYIQNRAGQVGNYMANAAKGARGKAGLIALGTTFLAGAGGYYGSQLLKEKEQDYQYDNPDTSLQRAKGEARLAQAELIDAMRNEQARQIEINQKQAIWEADQKLKFRELGAYQEMQAKALGELAGAHVRGMNAANATTQALFRAPIIS